MKQHITRKEVARMFDTVIFCDEITNIADICGIRPEYYNAGGFGWNWDAYDINGVALVYGYRGFPAAPWVQSIEGAKIIKHLRGLKTKRGRIAAAARLLTKFAGI